MDKPLRNILLNSTLAFVSAFVITTLLHELGHFVSYLFFEANPILYHNHVRSQGAQIGMSGTVISGLAGQSVSLLQGISFGYVVSRESNGNASHLLFLWLSLLGFVNFFGYLMMTPLSSVGDTGKIAELLQIHSGYRMLVALAGFAMLMFLIIKVGRNFADFIPAAKDEKERTKYVYRVMFFPILIGSIINTLLALPAPVVLSIVYPATSPFVIMISFSPILKSQTAATQKTEIEGGIVKWLVFLIVVCIIVNRLLANGLSISN